MSTTDERKFDAIQARYVRASESEFAYRLEVFSRKYAKCHPPASWITRTEAKRIETFRRAQDKALDAMCELLDRISPRAWCSGVPANWLMTDLTYADAITTGPLSVIPPIPYGYSRQQVERFASATHWPLHIAG